MFGANTATSTSGPMTLSIAGSTLDSGLLKLMDDEIKPGSHPSYELCKAIYVSHPLGAKMAEAPIKMAQSQPRTITVQDAPEEVRQAYLDEWENLEADKYIRNLHTLKRVYGIATVVMGCLGKPSDQPLDMDTLWQEQLYFNVLDPLNTAGSLVLNQIPNAPDFGKPTHVTVNGESFHRSRYRVEMNGFPIYIEWSPSAFGFVGRSVYQRALFPLKSFLRTMIADEMVAQKVGVLVAKQKGPGSIVDQLMESIAGLKRAILKMMQTGQVISIDVEEDIETVDLQNVDGAGTFARNNILNNIATSGDMPGIILRNETFTEGFGEGTEDAKTVAGFVNGERREMRPTYGWFDNIAQYRAWNPDFHARMLKKYPGDVPGDYREAFSSWRQSFKAEWPSLLLESESERVKTQETKFRSVISMLETVLDRLDPENQMLAIQWGADELGENKEMFAHKLSFNWDALKEHLEDKLQRDNEAQERALEGGFGEEGEGEEKSKKPRVQKLAAVG